MPPPRREGAVRDNLGDDDADGARAHVEDGHERPPVGVHQCSLTERTSAVVVARVTIVSRGGVAPDRVELLLQRQPAQCVDRQAGEELDAAGEHAQRLSDGAAGTGEYRRVWPARC